MADSPKVHGFELDDKYGLRVYEEAGEAVIKIRFKKRPPGGPGNDYIDKETGDTLQVTRRQEEEALARLRAEVLTTAPPNYLKNPGSRYRITVEGLSVAKDYKKIYEVDAADVLDSIYNEMGRIMMKTHGIRLDALYYGTVLSTYVLNQSQYLPARLPLTLLRSKVGMYRIRGQGMGLAKVGAVQRYSGAKSGQDFERSMKHRSELTRPNMKKMVGPAYKRGRTQGLEREAPVRMRMYGQEYGLGPPDYRANMVEGLDAPKSDRDQLGRPGKALTERDMELPPLEMSQRESMEIQLGETRGALQMRAGARNIPEFSR